MVIERQALAGLAVGLVVVAALHEAMQLRELGGMVQSHFMTDYYSVLELQDSATTAEVVTAFKRASQRFNANQQDEAQRERRATVVRAHETLLSPGAREAYDSRRRTVKMVSSLIACARRT